MAMAPQVRLILAAAALCALASPADAAIKLCNRLSYVAETAIGIEDRTGAATRGWFRIEPGACRAVIQLPIFPDHLYVHVRVPPVYGPAPLPLAGDTDLCISDDDFVIPGARTCQATGQRLARFIEIKPSDSADGQIAVIAEDAGYSDLQARRAGIQRLLAIVGYDAGAIDGADAPATATAMAAFIRDRGLPDDSANAETIFDLLIDAAAKPAGAGLSWCNDTAYPVMAALGLEDGNRRSSAAAGTGSSPANACGRICPARRNGCSASPKRSTPTAAPSATPASRCPGAAAPCCAPARRRSSSPTTRTAPARACSPPASPRSTSPRPMVPTVRFKP